jgi:hypothetical protein
MYLHNHYEVPIAFLFLYYISIFILIMFMLIITCICLPEVKPNIDICIFNYVILYLLFHLFVKRETCIKEPSFCSPIKITCFRPLK